MPVRNVLKCVLVICVGMIASCKNSNSTDEKKSNGKILQSEWYKHYSGTVNGKPVTLNLHHYGNITTGNYYYAGADIITDLTQSEDVVDNYDMHFTEYVRTERTEDIENYKPDRWSLNITDNTLKGKWTSGDGSKVFPIDLKEDYPAGSYPLALSSHADSIQTTKGAIKCVAVSLYQLLLPTPQMKKDESDFLQKTVLHLLGADTLGANTTKDYIAAEDKKYFKNYRILLADMAGDSKDHGDDWKNNFYTSRNIWALYNSNGMLDFEVHNYYFTGGDHGNFVSSYCCIDMSGKRVWRLSDMINIDAAKLLPMLDHEVRRIFSLSPKDTLTKRLSVDVVGLTENVFITDKGITFCYTPGEIAAEADGEVCVFLPYTQLSALLKDDFKKRMNLQPAN